MKLADVDVEELISSLRTERSAWINAAHEEKRPPTDIERTTMCVLHALENVLRRTLSV